MPEDRFGRLLRGWREQAGLTQEALATAAGLRTNTVQELETQASRVPRLSTVRGLAQALDLDPDAHEALTTAARARGAATPPPDEVAPRPRESESVPGASTPSEHRPTSGPSRPRRRRRWWLGAAAALVTVIAFAVDHRLSGPGPDQDRGSSGSSTFPAPPTGPDVHDLRDWPGIVDDVRIGWGEVTVAGRDFVDQLYYLDNPVGDFGQLTLTLGGQCSRLWGLAGMTDGSPPDARGEVLIYLDDGLSLERALHPAAADVVDVDLSGVLALRIALRATNSVEGGRPVLLDASLSCQDT